MPWPSDHSHFTRSFPISSERCSAIGGAECSVFSSRLKSIRWFSGKQTVWPDYTGITQQLFSKLKTFQIIEKNLTVHGGNKCPSRFKMGHKLTHCIAFLKYFMLLCFGLFFMILTFHFLMVCIRQTVRILQTEVPPAVVFTTSSP